jgi:pimeloyl-ACP methyl ester carboxylesterase
MNTPPTVVLVHGALTDASVWRGVSQRLQAAGRTVVAPSLPMRTFDGDVDYLRRFLETLDGPIVVAAHSYAGAVVSDPEALTDAVTALVYVAAFQPETGETAATLNAHFPGSLLTPDNLLVRDYPDGQEITLRPERFAEVYAADLTASEQAIMAAAQRPFDPLTLSGTFAGVPSWRTRPTWAVVSTADVSIPTRTLRWMAQRAGSTVVEVDSAHAVPVSQPDIVTDMIGKAAA